MKYTCSIQSLNKDNEYVIQEKGEVDLDQAIAIFQDFPFTDELQKLSGKESGEFEYPSIHFKNEKGLVFSISVTDNTGYQLHCENEEQTAAFFLSSAFDLNPQGWVVEDFIALFFEDRITERMTMENKPQVDIELEKLKRAEGPKTAPVTFYDGQFSYTIVLLGPVMLLAVAVYALIMFGLDNPATYLVEPVLFFFWLPPILVYARYKKKSAGLSITIDPEKKTLLYEGNGQRIQFNRADIQSCEVVQTHSARSLYGNFKYTQFMLKNGTKIIVPGFVAHPQNIVNILKPAYVIKYRIIPVLPAK